MIPRTILAKFYKKVFSFSQLFKIIDPKTFPMREIGFLFIQDDKKIFTRNRSFDTPEDLLKFLRIETPHAVMIGGMYDPPPKGESITKLKWLGHELIFDLDLTDYDDIRTCGKGKDHVCPKCWPLVRDAAIFIDETLKEDFGVRKITWVFSGRRGFHAWISDPDFIKASEEVREAIVHWIMPQGKINRPWYWQKRALRIFGGMADSIGYIAENILLKRKIYKIWHEKVVKKLPRIDRNVTIDINRLLRMPGSIHPATGRLVTIVKNLDDFYVDDSPTIYELVS